MDLPVAVFGVYTFHFLLSRLFRVELVIDSSANDSYP